jgi:hypothetical protein
VWLSKIHYGKKDYFLGNHPLWEFFRIAYQMTRKPYFIGGALLFFGYASAYLNRMERPISQELINFHRKEQMGRLKSILSSLLAFRIRILET